MPSRRFTVVVALAVVVSAAVVPTGLAQSAGAQDGARAAAPAQASLSGPLVNQVARSAAARACVQVRHRTPCGLVRSGRQVLGNGIAEYTFLLRVGAGKHDRIQVHRVVREVSPWRAAATSGAVFFLHGDVWGFDAAFGGELGLAQRAPNVAGYLATKRRDVWGIDLRWVLVPADAADVSFMHDWGFGTDLPDIRLATSFQRAMRQAEGSGHAKTALVGWSRGAELAYAYASLEATLPRRDRNVDALVPADGPIRYAPGDDYRQGICDAYAETKAVLDGGEAANSFAAFQEIGRAALTDPKGPSEFADGYTNLQLALSVGADANGFFNAGFHFAAGRFDPSGLVTSLRYTPNARFLRLLTQAASYESLGEFVDGEALFCGDVDVPFDDHLAAVQVPVLYLAAAGGFGSTGLYSTTLLGSRDVSHLIVRLQPLGHEATDFGHTDLWQASHASRLAWYPLLHWLRRH
jgi:hypothetical protein